MGDVRFARRFLVGGLEHGKRTNNDGKSACLMVNIQKTTMENHNFQGDTYKRRWKITVL